MSITNLTRRQNKTLLVVKEYFNKHGFSPTLEEIGRLMGISSPSAVHKHVKALREKGYLKNLQQSVRSVHLFAQDNNFREIPLLGKISAGEGIIPVENPEPIQVQSNMVSGNGNFYALRVEGDSMIDDGIFSGDIVIIKSQSVAQSGDTVIAIMNGVDELATIKKFYLLRDKVELRACNSKLPDWPRQFDAGDIEIRGKFCGLIRNEFKS